MKKLLIAMVLSLGLGYAVFNALAPTTENKLIDKVAYKNMLLKNQQGGIVDYSEKLEKVNMEIKELRQQLAQENQKKRG